MAKQNRQALINSLEVELKNPEFDIRKFINSNVAFKNIVSKMKRFLREHFALSQQEVETQILKICDSQDEKMAVELFHLLEEFKSAGGELSQADLISRHNFGLGVINDALNLFKSESENVSGEFIECLREAKRQGVDPFKFACKTNMRNASFDAFQETLSILTEKRYEALGNKTIVKGSELIDMLEQCTTLAFRLNEERVESVLALLSDFVYDKTSNSYIVDVNQMIKLCPSLLMIEPENLLETMALIENEMIQKRGMSKAEVVSRIALSPSILMVSSNTISTVKESLKSVIFNLLPDSQVYQGSKMEETAVAIADNMVYNLDNFTQLSSKSANENFSQMAKTLKNYLGADNAISCMQNLALLKRDPDVVEYVLAVLSTSPESDELRADFINSPTKYFEQYENFVAQKNDFANSERTRREKLNFAIQPLPQLNVEMDKIMELERKLNKNKRKEVAGLIKKAMEEMQRKKEEEDRKRKEQEEAYARAKQEKKEAEKAKKLASKQQIKEFKKAQQNKSNIAQPAPVISVQEQEKTTGEKIISALNGLIKHYKPLDKNKNYSLPEMVQQVYGNFYNTLKKKCKIEDIIQGDKLVSLTNQYSKVYSDRTTAKNLYLIICAEILDDSVQYHKKNPLREFMGSVHEVYTLDDATVEKLQPIFKDKKYAKKNISILEYLNKYIQPIIIEENDMLKKLQDSLACYNISSKNNVNSVALAETIKHLVDSEIDKYQEIFKFINLENETPEVKQKIEELTDKYFDVAKFDVEKIDREFRFDKPLNPTLNVKLMLQSYILPYLAYVLAVAHNGGLYEIKSHKTLRILQEFGIKLGNFMGQSYVSPSAYKLQGAESFIDIATQEFIEDKQNCAFFEEMVNLIGSTQNNYHGVRVKDDKVYFFSGQTSSDKDKKYLMIGSADLNEFKAKPLFKSMLNIDEIGVNRMEGYDLDIIPMFDDINDEISDL